MAAVICKHIVHLLLLIRISTPLSINETQAPYTIARNGHNHASHNENDTIIFTVLPGKCRLNTESEIVSKMKSNTKLIEYDVTITGYEQNPLLVNMTMNYRSNVWYRSASKHGLAILALAFNYDVLSLSMLTFGVEKTQLRLADQPRGCFGSASEEEKIKLMYVVLSADFSHDTGKVPHTSIDHVCHQIIAHDGRFYKKCCHRLSSGNDVTFSCMIDVTDIWIRILYVVLLSLKVAVFVCGPLLFKRYLYTNSTMKLEYVVDLCTPVQLTIHVRRLKNYLRNARVRRHRLKRVIGFDKFREFTKTVPSDTSQKITCPSLNLLVNHKKLVTEKRVPVGLLKSLFETIFLCGIRKIAPFSNMCGKSLFGSCESKCLCVDLASCRALRRHLPTWYTQVTWGRLFKLIGGVLLLLLVPLPYYIRLAAYYTFEHGEIQRRAAALESVGLSVQYGHSLLQYLTPLHPVLITCYVLYVIGFVVIVALRVLDSHLYEEVVLTPFYDMRHVSVEAALKMFTAHVLLPLEKFGLCGCIVGIPYWIIMLPIVTVVILLYIIPLPYLLFRIMIPKRPRFLQRKQRTSEAEELSSAESGKKERYLSDGARSVEGAFLLDEISPTRGLVVDTDMDAHESYGKRIGMICLRLCCLLLLLAVLMIMAEFLAFIWEVCVFTLMGTIVNAGIAAKYVMLVFWMLLYANSCYSDVYNQYVKMNSAVFSIFKDKLKADITKVTRKPASEQENTAFRYITYNPDDHHPVDVGEDNGGSDDREACRAVAAPPFVTGKTFHWTLRETVMFVDKKDKPRIPLQLFNEISQIKAPGCPGPIFKNLLRATRNFLYMILFLFFVLIVVMSFGNIYEISTTNQMIVTLAGGFLPFVIRFVLSPKVGSIHLNTYSFDGKIHEIIRKYHENWPIYDIVTQAPDVVDEAEGDEVTNRRAGNCDKSHHVDLLVTIVDPNGSDVIDDVIPCKKEIVITKRSTYIVKRQNEASETKRREYELLPVKRVEQV